MALKRYTNKAIEISLDTEKARSAYRVVPDNNDPIILQIEGRLARVVDISASGISCLCDGLQCGMRYRFSLFLPDYPHSIESAIDVVAAEDGLFRCRFVNLPQLTVDVLHMYVLRRQKRAIKQSMSVEY